MAARLPANEGKRLEALRRLGILDTPREPRFDRISRLAALALHCPVAFVCLVDAERVWFKSAQGVEIDSVPRDASICSHAILDNSPSLVVAHALKDVRCANASLRVHDRPLLFYACSALLSDDGQRVGALCIGDAEPRDLNSGDLELLRHFADL